jgi:hypothetical protein
MAPRLLLTLAGSSIAMACASSGTRPADMTGPQHEASAAAATTEAQRHEGRYDPRAEAPAQCAPYGVGDCVPYWSSVTNPTAHHLDDAKRHREIAAKHRAASAALREAEARSCAGVPAEDRDISPFYHREDIDRVERIQKESFGPGGLLGARLVFRAKPGLTAEWLQRVMDCHLAR